MRRSLVVAALVAACRSAPAAAPPAPGTEGPVVAEPAPVRAPLCDALDRYLAAAPDDFQALVGARTDYDYSAYHSTDVAPGATRCVVDELDAEDQAPITWSFDCIYLETDDAEAARAAYQALVADVRACLPGWGGGESTQDDGYDSGHVVTALSHPDAPAYLTIWDAVLVGRHRVRFSLSPN
ncbi:MAG: hypothetical protein R2939_16290 [Kofleriaceae bacterium]